MLHRPRTARVIALAVALAAPAHARAKEWYDHYNEAGRLIREGKCDQALPSLRQAIRLKSRSEVPARTYGLEFVEEYLPYYQQGVCHLRLGDYNAAVQMFNTEEEQGAIKKKAELWRELVRQRGDAEQRARQEREDAEQQRRVRLAQTEVARLRKETEDLQKEGKLEEALSRLAAAQEWAKVLEPGTIQQLLDSARRIREELNERQKQARRVKEIEDGLASARRLLESDPAQAKLQFDKVLALDPQNASALDGQREANAGILALTSRQERQAAAQEGKTLYDAGRFEEALVPLTKAAADLSNTEAARLLKSAQARVQRMQAQKTLRVRIETEMAKAERSLAASRVLEGHGRPGERAGAGPQPRARPGEDALRGAHDRRGPHREVSSPTRRPSSTSSSPLPPRCRTPRSRCWAWPPTTGAWCASSTGWEARC